MTTRFFNPDISLLGASISFSGWTSPNARNYTVTLDDTVTIFSARSSFTQADTLLFQRFGLDPATMHTLTAVNADGGRLAVNPKSFLVGTVTGPRYIYTSSANLARVLILVQPSAFAKRHWGY